MSGEPLNERDAPAQPDSLYYGASDQRVPGRGAELAAKALAEGRQFIREAPEPASTKVIRQFVETTPLAEAIQRARRRVGGFE